MKRIYLFMMCMWVCTTVFSQGIRFENISVKEALKRAEEEKKLVFVDMTASWCGPCQNIARTLFKEEKVGDYFNARFINIKCDIDTEEGKVLKKRYEVKNIPTFLILQPNGEVRIRMKGSNWQSDEFITGASRGMQEKSSLPYLSNLEQQGKKMSKQNLSDYLWALDAQQGFSDSIRMQLFRQLSEKERVRPEYWHLFRNQWGDNLYFHYVEEHLGEFKQNMGEGIINLYLIEGYSKLLIEMSLFQKVGDAQSIAMIDNACRNLSEIVLPDEESESMKELKGKLQNLIMQARAEKAYFYGDIRGMIDGLRVFTEAGRWEGVERFLLFYIGKNGTQEEKEEAGKVIKQAVLNLFGKDQRWMLVEEFRGYGIPISYFDELLDQYKQYAREQNKPLLIEAIHPDDDACRQMNRLLNVLEISGSIKALCVPVRGNAMDMKTVFDKCRFKPSVYPAYILITPDGKMIHAWTGVFTEDEFQNSLREGLEKMASN